MLVIFVVRGKTFLKASREINVLHQSSYLTPATCSTYLLVTPYIVFVVLEGKIHFMFVVHYCHGLTAHLATIQTVGCHSKTFERVKHHKTLKLQSFLKHQRKTSLESKVFSLGRRFTSSLVEVSKSLISPKTFWLKK